MDTSTSLDGLACVDCGASHDPADAPRHCPDCGGILRPTYDHEAVDVTRESLADERFDGVARFADLLPFPADSLVTLDEGTTPLIPCPDFADDLGVGAVYVKDEGANPTGVTEDRGAGLAVTAAREHGATKVALPTTGDAGQSVAAYAARAGIDSEAFVPTRSTFVAKAMTNVHGGDMSVVEGRYPDAVEAFETAMADDGNADWHSLAAFDSPYRHEGAKTLLFEVVEQLDWDVPDAVVHPTGHGLGVVGSHLAADQLRETGLVDEAPALHVAQPEDCAPVVAADDAGDDDTEPWERPDTLVGSLEVPDPAGGALALDAVRDTGGWAVGASDDDALEAAERLNKEGVEVSATGGVGAAAAQELAAGGHLDSDDVVVLVNPVAGNKENDVLRSHLMRKGI
ncbi:pyridoxal-phosphate dependent enzyme [Halosimplex amylolyticum]|uniref:pyridoxal-phosphate dependent enzyme n=1 Tax=Halosimplex amylolyticum TaxID=3396616 RepID=UPI003F545C4E